MNFLKPITILKSFNSVCHDLFLLQAFNWVDIANIHDTVSFSPNLVGNSLQVNVLKRIDTHSRKSPLYRRTVKRSKMVPRRASFVFKEKRL